MSSENKSANSTCRIFVLIVFLMVVGAFILVIGTSEDSTLRTRRHFSTAAPASNQ